MGTKVIDRIELVVARYRHDVKSLIDCDQTMSLPLFFSSINTLNFLT